MGYVEGKGWRSKDAMERFSLFSAVAYELQCLLYVVNESGIREWRSQEGEGDGCLVCS